MSDKCPKCGKAKWRTIQKFVSWRCRGCGLIMEKSPGGVFEVMPEPIIEKVKSEPEYPSMLGYPVRKPLKGRKKPGILSGFLSAFVRSFKRR